MIGNYFIPSTKKERQKRSMPNQWIEVIEAHYGRMAVRMGLTAQHIAKISQTAEHLSKISQIAHTYQKYLNTSRKYLTQLNKSLTITLKGKAVLRVLNLNFWGLGWPWGSDKEVRWGGVPEKILPVYRGPRIQMQQTDANLSGAISTLT